MLHIGHQWICNAIKGYKQYDGICLVSLIEKEKWKRIHVDSWQEYLEISYLYTAVLVYNACNIYICTFVFES